MGAGLMGRKPDEKKPDRGQMRRRWRSFLEDGSLGRLRSEGRLMALYALYWADFSDCTLRFSIRGAAKSLGVGFTTARRGLTQLVDMGILEVVGEPDTYGRVTYRFAEAHTSGVRPDHEPCAPPITSGDQGAHEPCAPRTRAVIKAHTSGVRITRFPSGISKNTRMEINQSTTPGSGGFGPPDRAEEGGAA